MGHSYAAPVRGKPRKTQGSQPLKSQNVQCPECRGMVKLKNLKSHRGNPRKCAKAHLFKAETPVREEPVRQTVSAGRSRYPWER